MDGVGYGSVGSIAGISNPEIALLLKLRVILVINCESGSLGISIDNFHMSFVYFNSIKKGIVLGVIFNKIPIEQFNFLRENISRYFDQLFSTSSSSFFHENDQNNDNNQEEKEKIKIFGFIPLDPSLNQQKVVESISKEEISSLPPPSSFDANNSSNLNQTNENNENNGELQREYEMCMKVINHVNSHTNFEEVFQLIHS